MALPQRLGTALSIFLPARSVYADLDNPPAEPDGPFVDDPTDERTPPRLSESSVYTAPGESKLADDDPFAPISPAVLSPAPATRALGAETPRSSSSPHRHDTAHAATDEPFAPMHDARDPFQPDPIHVSPGRSQSRSPDLTPTSSVYAPSHATPQPQLASQAGRSPPNSVTSSRRTRSGLGASRSIGNRSLMGLLGGTRYDGPGFPFGGVGVGEEEEDEDAQAAGPRRTPPTDDLRSLAATLPPPPSALSASSHDDTEEEEDAPPDFTARIPLVSSTHSSSRRRAVRASHPAASAAPSSRGSSRRRGGPAGGILGGRSWAAGMNAKERALWRWVNVTDLDGFLQQVYLYYVGKGIWAIGLERTLNLLTVGWVIGFSTFLLGCIDYPRLWDSHKLSDVVISRCTSRMSGFTLLLFITFAAFYAWRVVRFGIGVRKLWEMHEFYTELLEVPEGDIQTIPWHSVVTRLSALRATHPSALSSRSNPGAATERLDAHDVANRIMREENYLIALFNKDLLDISLPLPAFLRSTVGRVTGKKRFGKSMLTQTLEWNLSFCLLGFLFGRDGQVRRAFLSERNKGELVEALRRRFILMGLINAIFAPFIVLYLLFYSFFRYFEEYHKNPSSIGSRHFTPLARWKFREFNELPHHFQQRLALVHPLADQYINHYPKAKTVLLSRFVAFLAGSFAAVLILFSLIDPDAFLHFEITPGRTVLFYIGVFGTILAVARGMVPDENRVVDPEELMRAIVEHTHYMPADWKDKLHSTEVHVAFGKLFQMKVALFVQELLSVLITPFVLWYTLPSCAGPVVDFFREFTVHVDGLGYVCSFAVFDFKRHGDPKFGAPVQPQEEHGRDQRWRSTEGKMEKSFLTFAASNPAWVPRDQTQSLFLSKMTEAPSHAGGVGASHHLLHPAPLGASSHHPHSRHASSASTALHHARGTPRSRFHGPSRLALAEEEPDDEAQDGAAVRADKARLYDRAFQQSALLGHAGPSSAGTAGHVRRQDFAHGSSAGGAGGSRKARDEVIDEESALDGDVFVAPTQAQPFGLPSDDDDDEEDGGRSGGRGEGGGASGEVQRMRNRGLGGLMSEMMHR
ncbi:autophagy protein ATG9 [Rhodotorula paludigena]|uniref:autophagy protein ATG9 n=1 Tax=Rhodotorula paludigena TaxID=86838 RepID=UPI00317724DA